MSTSQTEQATLFLQAGIASIQSGLLAQAQHALDSVNQEYLTSEQYQAFILSQLELGVKLGDIKKLEQYEPKLNLESALRASLSEQEKRVRLLASTYSLIDKPLKAAILLSDFEGVFGIQERARLNEEIWLMLQRSSTESLIRHNYEGRYPNTLAWLELAQQLKLRQASIDQQYATLQEWIRNHPAHPATNDLPLELKLLSKLPETAPKEIILALPLSGTYAMAGNAVRDGFMANYYLQARSESAVTVRTFDTAANTISSLYDSIEQSANLDNNTLVIGPLIKSTLEELVDSAKIRVPTLALNDLDTENTPANLYLFGLNPNDELQQIAKKMVLDELFRIGVIAPHNQRGKRLAQSFAEKLAAAGGHVVSTKLYDNQATLSETVSNLLSTTNSKLRARSVRAATGMRIESEPRRRQDLDAIFMIADNQIGKQIKPMLAFNFAADLPVFASSQIHNPLEPNSNSDLNGVQFVDIPWMFARTAPPRSQIDQLLPAASQQYARFFALGADAYTLAPRLQLLLDIENTHVQGQTGMLSVSPEGRVRRELQWARYHRGKAQTIN